MLANNQHELQQPGDTDGVPQPEGSGGSLTMRSGLPALSPHISHILIRVVCLRFRIIDQDIQHV
eukprot:1160455-Pelagomonas_calceolata.AAC.3